MLEVAKNIVTQNCLTNFFVNEINANYLYFMTQSIHVFDLTIRLLTRYIYLANIFVVLST